MLCVKFYCEKILNSLLPLRFLYIINIYNYLNEVALAELVVLGGDRFKASPLVKIPRQGVPLDTPCFVVCRP